LVSRFELLTQIKEHAHQSSTSSSFKGV